MKTGNGEKMKIASASMLAVLFCIWIAACKLDSRDTGTGTASSESFSKIYDRPDKSTYTAVDIKQTEDGGYIILGMVDRYPYLLRIDREGNYIWDTEVDIFLNYEEEEEEEIKLYDFVEPVPDILIQGRDYYFFCSRERQDNKRNKLSLLKISDYDRSPSRVWIMWKGDSYLDDSVYIYPMNAKALNDRTGNNEKILVLALNGKDYKLYLAIIKIEKGVELEGIIEKIFPHNYSYSHKCHNMYPLPDKRYHFINIIKNRDSGGKEEFYCQSFLKWLTDKDEPCFRIGAFLDISKNFDNDNFPLHEIDTPFISLRQSASSSYYGVKIEDKIVNFYTGFKSDEEKKMGYSQPELVESKEVFIETMNVNNEETVFFAGSSKNNKIVLYKYENDAENHFPKRYFGSTHIYEVHALMETEDGGLAILGTTYVAGRLGRICLFKLSKNQLEDFNL